MHLVVAPGMLGHFPRLDIAVVQRLLPRAAPACRFVARSSAWRAWKSQAPAQALRPLVCSHEPCIDLLANSPRAWVTRRRGKSSAARTALLQICVHISWERLQNCHPCAEPVKSLLQPCALAARRRSDEFGRPAERWLRGHSEVVAGTRLIDARRAQVPRRAGRRSFKTLFHAGLCRLQRRWVPRRERVSLTYLHAA